MLEGSSEIKKLEAKKRKHIWSVQVMRKLLQQTIVYEYEHDGSSPLPSEVDETYSNMEELQENAQHTKNDKENEKNQSEDIKNKDGEGNAMRVSSSILMTSFKMLNYGIYLSFPPSLFTRRRRF